MQPLYIIMQGSRIFKLIDLMLWFMMYSTSSDYFNLSITSSSSL